MVGKREMELSWRHRPNTIHHSTTWRAERSWPLINEGAHLIFDFIPSVLFCLLVLSLPALKQARPCSVLPSHHWSPYLEDIASILYLSRMVSRLGFWFISNPSDDIFQSEMCSSSIELFLPIRLPRFGVYLHMGPIVSHGHRESCSLIALTWCHFSPSAMIYVTPEKASNFCCMSQFLVSTEM